MEICEGKSSCSKCSVAECFPEKKHWCWNEQVYQERCDVLDITLYENIPLA